MTQAKLSSRAGIGRVTLTHRETGEHHPRTETLTAIAGALRVEVEDMILPLARQNPWPITIWHWASSVVAELPAWLQPKLSGRQQRELCLMHATSEYSISDLAGPFSVARPTVYRILYRRLSP